MTEEAELKTDNFNAILDFDAGVYAAKINGALIEAALAAVVNGKDAKVTLEIKIHPIAQTRQVHITHSVKKLVPRLTGETLDTDIKQSTMHVHRSGQLSPFDEDQMGFHFSKSNQE